jgi:hypothetical protein
MKTKTMKLPMLGQFRVTKVAECPPVAVIDKPIGYVNYWREVIATSPFFHPDKEHMVVVALNTKLNAKGWHIVSVGDLSGTYCGAREIMRPLILCAASRFILMHNHPSGDPAPSDLDRKTTRRIREAGEVMGIEITDHIIIGDGTDKYFSFREHGLLDAPATGTVVKAPARVKTMTIKAEKVDTDQPSFSVSLEG